MLGITAEMVIIGAVRVLGSLPVLRWAFVGAIIAILVDFSDLFLMNLIDLGGVGEYQRFDKALDQVYMATFLIVALRWEGRARRIAVGLYLFRLVGVIAYQATAARGLLPFFPNLFEFWFVFVAAQRHWWPGFRYSGGHIAGWGALLLAAKEGQEYALHTARWLDGFTAVEAVQAIWRWLNT